MQQVKESVAEINLYTAKTTKSKLIKRLEDRGIYKSSDKENEEQKYFIDMQQEYLNEMMLTDQIRASTLKQMKSMFTNINRFSDVKKYPLTFDKINLEFYKVYGDWVLKEENNFDNFYGSLIKRLRTWLGWCVDERNIHVNIQFKSKKFRAPREEKDVVYLKLNELEMLDNFRNHTQCKPSWIRVIDMALVQCSIGCRYSDMVDCSWYFDQDFLKGYTIKNDSKYLIPIKTSKWLTILKQYNMSFKLPVHNKPDVFKVLSEQKFNKYIKEILQTMYNVNGMQLEETEMIVTKQTRRGVPVFSKNYKYTFITSHSFRRSFISRMVRLGYTEAEVALMVGTKSLDELRKYFKLEEEDLRVKTELLHS